MCESIPLVVCEFHQEVLAYIHRHIARKRLPFIGLVMLHFDSHPDLVYPRHLVAADCFVKEKMYKELEIADWILPLMYAGHLKDIVWVRPSWAEQIPDGVCRFEIGEEKQTKKLRLTCTEDYFLEDGLWSPLANLQNIQNVSLQTSLSGDLLQRNTKNDVLPKTGDGFILDIDLDYFSVTNPFLQDFTDEEYAALKKVYRVSFDPKAKKCEERLALTVAESERKFERLRDVVLRFGADEEVKTSNEEEKLLVEVLEKIQLRRAGEDVEWELVHDAGMTTEVPHHVSTESEIEYLIDEMVTLLKTLPPPALITMARSTEDEYCPPDQIDWIQQRVIDALRGLYNDVTGTLDYEDISINV